ncbi:MULTISPECIES: GlsB/YeaQ/YmgE family stress response membrane protein [Paenibacillus]|uniref:GlsB/YeaQ/YmgE family stress response membrane protein n=1 Tax=Paenibacillus campinasensis TaxID=66347 RepID=A0A268EMW5_9BACL|nr:MULTISPECIES: GlsB/YeaQ/YmgE family stress response membrane protein [Paenibacillus]MUG66962.1 GlsB/YeaQ/YmgE family stress response membrane protein [Paenibacillus campinasensis]PAD74448.1 GlsB/YeaQ/YmgE family stress response membrane protein [Paenibacillus campinasensis]PAK50846.1 GlsB/YeaQ/YmgE family stress response membrane protein [Paenibacillus sp. 7541]
MWGVIITIVMAIIIGIIGDALAGHNMPGGIIGAMIAGFVGAWVGTWLFGAWGPEIGGFAILPAILGTALFVFLLGFVARMLRRAA